MLKSRTLWQVDTDIQKKWDCQEGEEGCKNCRKTTVQCLRVLQERMNHRIASVVLFDPCFCCQFSLKVSSLVAAQLEQPRRSLPRTHLQREFSIFPRDGHTTFRVKHERVRKFYRFSTARERKFLFNVQPSTLYCLNVFPSSILRSRSTTLFFLWYFFP